MPFDGSGNFALVAPETPFISGTPINSADMNSVLEDIGQGLSLCLTRDGQSVPLQSFNFGGQRGINLAPPTIPSDAATLAVVLTASEDRSMGGFRLTGAPAAPSSGDEFVSRDYVLGLSNNLPVQTAHAKELLKTDGSSSSWTGPSLTTDTLAFAQAMAALNFLTT